MDAAAVVATDVKPYFLFEKQTVVAQRRFS